MKSIMMGAYGYHWIGCGLAATLTVSLFSNAQAQISFHQLYKQAQSRPIEVVETPDYQPLHDDDFIPEVGEDQFVDSTYLPPPDEMLEVQVEAVEDEHSSHGYSHGMHSEITPLLSCHPGFELNGEVCQAVHYVSGTPSCSKKADLYENGYCITIEEVKQTSKCPATALSDGKKCFYTEMVVPEVYCPKHYELAPDGKACARKKSSKSQPQCPSGFNLKHKECVKEIKLDPIVRCPQGYLHTHDSKKDMCVQSDVVPPERKCKDKSYSLQGDHCVKIEIADPVSKCPKGFKNEGGGWCTAVETSKAEALCPEGTVSSKKGCVEVSYDALIPFCKKDYIFEGNSCRKFEEKAVVLKCPEGYKFKEGACIQKQASEPGRLCPEGTTESDKGCWQYLDVPSTPYCEKGELDENGMCSNVHISAPKQTCKSGSLATGLCKHIHTTQADPVCPPGAHLEGKYCIAYSTEPAAVFCKKSGGIPGPDGCISVEQGEMLLQCPHGWKLHGEQCSQEVEGETLYLCPHGMTLNGKKCEGRRAIPSETECPKGFSHLDGGICVTTETSEPISSCPPGYILTNGMCFPAAPQKKTGRRLSVEARRG